MVNTYIAVQSRSKEIQSLEVGSQAVPVFTQLRRQYGDIRQELAALQLQQNLTASTNDKGFHVLNQLKQELESTVFGPLQNITGAAAMLVQKAATLDARLHELQPRNDTVGSTAAPPPAAPAGVTTEEKELHHIATHQGICDKHGASGLKLDITKDLIAPVVIVAYNRVGYLARSFISWMK
jgi:hypothetical protein